MFSHLVCDCPGPLFQAFKVTDEMNKTLTDLLHDRAAGPEMPPPITCGRCGKWFRYNRTCEHCGEEFYHWFQHPREPVGRMWCWNCVVDHSHTEHPNYKNHPMLRPRRETLPPGYILATGPTVQNTEALGDAVAAFLEVMKGL